MNYCVHTVMYGYFALRAARVRLPRFLQQFITIFQLIQMIIGCIVNIVAFYYKQQEYSCATSYMNIILSLLLYTSYLFLFAHFFYMSYLHKHSMKNSKERTD